MSRKEFLLRLFSPLAAFFGINLFPCKVDLNKDFGIAARLGSKAAFFVDKIIREALDRE